eukprot:1367194-Amorphochlora_amoeboformis.AAC.1
MGKGGDVDHPRRGGSAGRGQGLTSPRAATTILADRPFNFLSADFLLLTAVPRLSRVFQPGAMAESTPFPPFLWTPQNLRGRKWRMRVYTMGMVVALWCVGGVRRGGRLGDYRYDGGDDKEVEIDPYEKVFGGRSRPSSFPLDL